MEAREVRIVRYEKGVRRGGCCRASMRVLRYTFPAGASSIGDLIPELLRRGYGLGENVRLEIGIEGDA